MIKQKPFAANTPGTSQKPVGLRGIAGMKRVKSAAPQLNADGQDSAHGKAPCKLGQIAQNPFRFERHFVTVDVDIVYSFE
jgi:hypothetical protein